MAEHTSPARAPGEAPGNRGAVLRLLLWSGVFIALVAVFPRVPLTLTPLGDPAADRLVNHLLGSLPVAILALGLTWLAAPRERLSHLSMRRSGEMRPSLGRGDSGRWETDGWWLGGVMTGVVALVVLTQFIGDGFAFEFRWVGLLMVVPFAALNAFIEESLFRVPFVTLGAELTSSRVYGLVMGAGVFGVLHYWGGAPNGLTGALMSLFTGYVLAKSMQETRGFFWALAIHGMLDLPIFFLLLNQAP